MIILNICGRFDFNNITFRHELDFVPRLSSPSTFSSLNLLQSQIEEICLSLGSHCAFGSSSVHNFKTTHYFKHIYKIVYTTNTS